jgi:hypothetical protein
MNKKYSLPLDIDKDEQRFEYDEEEDSNNQDEFNDDGNELVPGVHGDDMSDSSHQS